MTNAAQRPIVHVPEEIGNKYRFVVVAGKRCEQLQHGAFPKVEVVVPVNRLGQAQDAPKLASFWAQVSVKEVEEGRIAFEEHEVITLDYTTEVPISVE
ncbi:MAG: DNA-directed RNA polymerase subunit omega [Holophagaceae bacterium]|nr:DNA-directed RNA polymerase subunit omega [Holophagaceae bacterium]